MRRGQDRFEIGASVLDVLFPEGSPLLRGIGLGELLADVVQREGVGEGEGPTTQRYVHELEDPLGNGRRVEVRLHHRQGRVHLLSARFYSMDRMDVDAAYRRVKEHLDAALGKPEKEVTGLLTFFWRLPGDVPARTSVSRFKDDQQRNVLDVGTKPEGV